LAPCGLPSFLSSIEEDGFQPSVFFPTKYCWISLVKGLERSILGRGGSAFGYITIVCSLCHPQGPSPLSSLVIDLELQYPHSFEDGEDAGGTSRPSCVIVVGRHSFRDSSVPIFFALTFQLEHPLSSLLGPRRGIAVVVPRLLRSLGFLLETHMII